MTTALRVRKFDRFFDLLDTDGSGFVEAEDWARTAKALIEGFGHPADSPRASALRDTYARIHETVRSAMDTDGDGRVSREEFHVGIRAHVADPALFDRTFRPAVDAEFDTADLDGDGILDETEIRGVWRVWGMSEADATSAMKHMDQDGDGQVTRDEYYAAWREYLMSEDPDAPGSWILGEL
ncbi:EF-hand domain-containing protein [Umezawaea sp. Da 62-37]|uniref:EF-hand domain-containing protein n=1 Tax=Umezawaea sp. Da 62-37 TaxID=3075927 RepID=UPI0028F711D6|nr:EF-hand domain-containing protein [Umezawaea sp. Da 62-37]WNV82281.1 EF-hand domain-containing protein [Umezawaea sp. Da 62-37]